MKPTNTVALGRVRRDKMAEHFKFLNKLDKFIKLSDGTKFFIGLILIFGGMFVLAETVPLFLQSLFN